MTILVPEDLPEKLFREDGKRLDGRAVDEIRPFRCEIGVLKNADGSAYVEHGGNKIYAGVYGPREIRPRHLAKPDRGVLIVNYRMTTFSVHERKSPAPNRREKEISKVIEEAITPTLFLELYPGAAIEVNVLVFAADGGTRCACTTAVSLALADAGIPMKTLVCGVAAGKANGVVILDCSDKEDKVGDADVPVVVQMIDNKINLLQFDGQMTPEELEQGLNYVKKGAKQIFDKMIYAIKAKYNQIQEEVKEEERSFEMKKDKETETAKETEKAPTKVETPKTESNEVKSSENVATAHAQMGSKENEQKIGSTPNANNNINQDQNTSDTTRLEQSKTPTPTLEKENKENSAESNQLADEVNKSNETNENNNKGGI